MTPELPKYVIAAWLDLPSVYMSGPSDRSLRKAEDLIEQLAVNDLEIVEKVQP